MKIIIVGTAYPFRGGLSAFNQRLAREFMHQGHEVEIITFTLQYPAFLFPGKTQFSDEAAPENLKINREINSVHPLNWIKTGKMIRRKKPDLVVFAYWMSFFAPCFGTIARMVRSPKTKCIALIHNMIPHEPTILDKIFPRYFVSAMDGFTAMANAVVEDINKFDRKSKPKIVYPHPIYDDYGKQISKEKARKLLKLQENGRYLLFFGFIRRYKGLDLLLDAMADERIRAMNIRLLVAGEFYEEKAFYDKKIDLLNLQETVEFRSDFIPDEEVKNYFCAVDMIVQPYRSATQSGVSQIAYHFDKPMLVTDVGGLAETIPNGKVGYVVDVNPAEIADAIVDFYENNRSETFIENIKEEKKKYQWSGMVEAIIESRTKNQEPRFTVLDNQKNI